MDAPIIFDLQIPDTQSLHKLYMPFLNGGGLFLPTSDNYVLGAQLFVVLTLPEAPEQLALVCKVVWITPAAAQNQRKRGIGMQFLEEEGRVRMLIENLLAGTVDISMTTFTI